LTRLPFVHYENGSPFVDKESNGSYSLANGLNGLIGPNRLKSLNGQNRLNRLNGLNGLNGLNELAHLWLNQNFSGQADMEIFIKYNNMYLGRLCIV
jgi:hypothetical protein